MASDPGFMDYVMDQIGAAGRVEFRKMFGEYAVYCDSKVVALVCDNQLYLKPTPAGRALLGTAIEAPPYPGAKPYFLIQARLDDRAAVTELIRCTAEALPLPRPKKSAAARRANAS